MTIRQDAAAVLRMLLLQQHQKPLCGKLALDVSKIIFRTFEIGSNKRKGEHYAGQTVKG